jgi:hypothetical protein
MSIPGSHPSKWWIGNKFVDGKYVNISFANLEASKWVCHIKLDLPNQNDNSSTIGPFDVEVLADDFFLVKGHVIGFWIFMRKEAERLLMYNPVYGKDERGELLKFDRGWMRFAYAP